MADRITDIKGMTPELAGKFAEHGIRTTDQLLQQAATGPQRSQLAKQLGIPPSELTEYLNRADLMRIKGVGREMANLLEEGGVDSIKELRRRRPDNLTETLQRINAEKKIAYRAPTLAQVEQWIAEAKTIDATTD